MASNSEQEATAVVATKPGSASAEQEQTAIRHKPVTVSSLSSIDTAGYDLNDLGNDHIHTSQQSAVPPSLQPPPINAVGNGNNTTADHSFSMPPQSYQIASPENTTSSSHQYQQEQQHQQQHPQPHHRPLPSPSISLLGRSTMQLSPSTGVVLPSVPTTNTVPEFLYQLTKMLTDNNRDIIEWSNGKIEVHSPHKLETHVLNRYFRHSKFASFQRQLNYFGFRKLAGKGKMAPCSYVNDSTTSELGSLLLVKRKQGNEPKTKDGKKRDREGKGDTSNRADDRKLNSTAGATSTGTGTVNPALAGIAYRSSIDSTTDNHPNNGASQQSQKALARVAVGRGVRHGFIPRQQQQSSASSAGVSIDQDPRVVAPSPVQASLNALTNNYRNSLNELENFGQSFEENQTLHGTLYAPREPAAPTASSSASFGYVPGSLRRDDSLVDLAMIPLADEGTTVDNTADSTGFSFVDFPFDPGFFSSDDFNDNS